MQCLKFTTAFIVITCIFNPTSDRRLDQF